ncbi:hypothetical protein CQA53_09330 [Helicobacter didelphidarum]|uniref:Uncharacterized protein n=1 Tax=Helicobacter didelphidarum TaxID=2040648 RepID=A0A3D8IBC4_9HELI|nr:hypothetical protein [Helicobacter didelphidarum]RDU62398.1 hypothetical protein CQA53_09330 [Helicobacter didelphidarum]
MKRLFSIFVLALTPGISSLSANTQVAQVQTSHHQFQQSDADFLFNGVDTSKVAVLDNQELEDIRGNVWPYLIFSAFFTHATFLNAPGQYSPIYTGTISSNIRF